MESKSDSRKSGESGVCRASDLPIYTQCEEIDFGKYSEEQDHLPGYLETAVNTTKKVFTKCSESYVGLKETGMTIYASTKENMSSMYHLCFEHINYIFYSTLFT